MVTTVKINKKETSVRMESGGQQGALSCPTTLPPLQTQDRHHACGYYITTPAGGSLPGCAFSL